jgi:hypothetical protein
VTPDLESAERFFAELEVATVIALRKEDVGTPVAARGDVNETVRKLGARSAGHESNVCTGSRKRQSPARKFSTIVTADMAKTANTGVCPGTDPGSCLFETCPVENSSDEGPGLASPDR